MLKTNANYMYRRCYANSWKDEQPEKKQPLLAPTQQSPLLLRGVDPFDPFVDLAFLFVSQTSFKLCNSSVLGCQNEWADLRHDKTWNLELQTPLSGFIQREPADLSSLPISFGVNSILLNVAP